MTDVSPVAQATLSTLLLPIWQVAIGLCVLAAVVVVAGRLALRGPSRIKTALLITGGAVLAVCAVGILLERL